MDEGRTDATEQVAVTSTNGKAEPTHAVDMDLDPTKHTLYNWLNRLEKREERQKLKEGKIDRVPDLLQTKSDYQPQVVSLGPYHFGKEELRKLQQCKHRMAEKLVSHKEESLRYEIHKNIDNLMVAYSSERIETKALSCPSEWEEMFYLDGCFVLHFIYCILFNQVKDLGIERWEIDAVHKDLFLMENQLPFELLKILSGNDPGLIYWVDQYIVAHKISNYIAWVPRQDKTVHLLDRLRTIIIGGRSYTNKWQPTFLWPWQWQSASAYSQPRSIVLRNAKELTAREIHLKPNRTGFLKDILFQSRLIYGTLKLPRIIVDHTTGHLFMNLVAYEMYADVDSIITSYICLLHSLVNDHEDVEELESVGILVNHLPTSEIVVNLFNEMSQSVGILVNHLATREIAINLFDDISQGLHPDEDAFMDVKKKIQKFFEHRAEGSTALWVVEGYYNHIKNPLNAMAVVAASLVIGLTICQTYFTIFPRGNK